MSAYIQHICTIMEEEKVKSYKLGLKGWVLGARWTSMILAVTLRPGRNTPFLSSWKIEVMLPSKTSSSSLPTPIHTEPESKLQ